MPPTSLGRGDTKKGSAGFKKKFRRWPNPLLPCGRTKNLAGDRTFSFLRATNRQTGRNG
jgi:hypothetical protein